MLKYLIFLISLSFMTMANPQRVNKGWTTFKFVDDQGLETTGQVRNYRYEGNPSDFKKFRANPRYDKYIKISAPAISKALPQKLTSGMKLKINSKYKHEVRNIKTRKVPSNGTYYRVGNIKDINQGQNIHRQKSRTTNSIASTSRTYRKKARKSGLPKKPSGNWDPSASLRKFYD